MSTRDTPATFQTRVNLVMVPVVVRDRSGNAVGNLTQENFQLLDRGKPQMILKFSMERGDRVRTQSAEPAQPGTPLEQTPQGMPERFLAYLFDDAHMQFGDLVQARTATAEHLARALTANTRVAVYTTSGRTMLDFTDDRQKISETLLRIRPATNAIPGSQCPDLNYTHAERIERFHDTQATNVAIDETIRCTGLEGQPNAAQLARTLVQSAATRIYNENQHTTQVTFSLLRNLVKRMSVLPGTRSLILLSSGFPLAERFTDESEVLDMAIRGNLTIHAVDVRGLWVLPPGGDISQPFQGTIQGLILKDQYAREEMSNNAQVLRNLSYGTAGTFIQNTNDLKGGLDRIAAPPEYYYVLGFSPQNLKVDGRFHTLKVTLKDRRDVTIQARHGYFAPKEILDPAKAAEAEITEALFSRDELNDLPVQVSTRFFKSTDVNARLSVIARLDVRGLHFRKSDDRNLNTVTVVSGLFDRNGNYLQGVKKTIDFRMREVTLESITRSGITIKSNFDVTPGTYAIRVVVRDSEARMMAAHNTAIEIP